MRILVTGASGFIGSYLCGRLASNNEVIGLYRSAPPNVSGLTHCPGVRFHQADLADNLSIPGKIDAIVHTAGRIFHPDTSAADYVKNNIVATRNLVKFAIQKHSPLVIFLSTISIHGRIDSRLVDEETSIQDPAIYGMSKYIAEKLLKEQEAILPSVILRLPIVVAPGMKSGWLATTYDRLLKGQSLGFFNGVSPYNMLHMSDIYELVVRSLRRDEAGSEAFAVGCKNLMSIKQIVYAIKDHVHSASVITEDQREDSSFVISTAKAERLLGFQPQAAEAILDSFLQESDRLNAHADS